MSYDMGVCVGLFSHERHTQLSFELISQFQASSFHAGL